MHFLHVIIMKNNVISFGVTMPLFCIKKLITPPIISTQSVNRLVFLNDMDFVLLEEETDVL